MKATPQSKYLWLIVDKRETCSPEPDKMPPSTKVVEWKVERKEYLDWYLQDEAAQGFMKGVTESLQWLHVSQCKTVKDMWDMWKKVHVDNQQKINIHYFFEEMYMCKYVC